MSAENNETPTQETPQNNLISLDNCDFSNKSNIINSPRSIKACLCLGIELAELYKLNMDEFKKKYPEVKKLDEELLKLRYDAEEKFRESTVEQAKKERQKIIEEEEKGNKNNQNNKKDEKKNNGENKEENQENQENKDEETLKWEKIIEKEKKGIEKIKKRQKQNIENLIEEQINKELIVKVNEVKEQIKKEKEDSNKKELEEKRKKEDLERKKKEEAKRKEFEEKLMILKK